MRPRKVGQVARLTISHRWQLRYTGGMAYNPPAAQQPRTHPSPLLLGPNDKWLLASQIQKGIRHGKSDAASWAAEQLHAIDHNYLRYRLSVIAVEDVAAGNPGLIAEAFSGGWGKRAVESRGGLGFLSSLVRQMADGVKSRLPCDWMGCTRWLIPFEEAHGPWKELPMGSSIDMAQDATRPWWERGLAAWRAAGTTRFSTPHLPEVAGDWERWKAACAETTQDKTTALTMSAGEHQREPHPVFLGLALMDHKTGGSSIVSPSIPPLPEIGPWLSATFDKHTSEGKKAYRRWLATHHEADSFLSSHHLDDAGKLDAIGRMAFWIEGGRCNRHVETTLSKQVLTDIKSDYLRRSTLPAREFAALCVDPQGWHDSRSAVMRQVSPQGFRP